MKFACKIQRFIVGQFQFSTIEPLLVCNNIDDVPVLIKIQSIVDQYGIAGESRFRIHFSSHSLTGGRHSNNYSHGDKGQPFLIDSGTLLICFTTIEEIRLNCEVAVFGVHACYVML